MKLNLIAVATFMVAWPALAVQAPVSDVSSGSSFEERLDQLERIIDARNSAQMNLLQQVTQLQDEVSELRGVTEEHAYQLEQLLTRQRELYQEIDRRLANQPAASTSTSTQVDTSTVDTSASGASSSGSNYSDNLSENDAYDRAIKLVLEDKRYEQATVAFQEFIERFPESSYAPNAHYWLGQLLFSAGEYGDAEEQFLIVVDRYEDSNKRADCMLKLGSIARQQDRNEDAKRYFNDVLNNYPDSTEATLAKQRLAEL